MFAKIVFKGVADFTNFLNLR